MRTKRSRRLSTSVTVRQKQTLYVAIAGTVVAGICGVLLFIYLNTGNHDDTYAAAGSDFTISSGFWNDNILWDSRTFPGTNNINKDIEVFKNITSFDGGNDASLSFGNNVTLTVTDTLVVHGNLTIGNNSELLIGTNGVLVVTGNLTASNKLSIASGGVIAVGGDADFGNKLAYDDSGGGELFVLGDANELSGENSGGAALRATYPEIDDIIQGNITALPISLLSFDATVQSKQVLIEWVTESETHNDYFTIERSPDGEQVEIVGTVPGAGDSQKILSYSFTDPQPLSGTSYYRLRQTDYDGQNEAFEWVAVTVARPIVSSPNLSIDRLYPNPITDRCTIVFTLSNPGPVIIEILNAQGTVLLSESTQGYIGRNQHVLSNLSGLPSGTYLVRLVRNGTASSVQRILKE